MHWLKRNYPLTAKALKAYYYSCLIAYSGGPVELGRLPLMLLFMPVSSLMAKNMEFTVCSIILDLRVIQHRRGCNPLSNSNSYIPCPGFVVQLRSLDDHLPLSGITVGDIGMKFGSGAYNSMDNGVLRFDNVHIPRDHMLMR